MQKKIRITLLLTAGILLLLLFVRMQYRQTPAIRVMGAYAITQDLYNSIYTTGEIEAVQSSEFTVPVSAEVTKVMVQVGDAVTVGQPLLELTACAPQMTAETWQTYAQKILQGETADMQALQKSVLQTGQNDIIRADLDGVVLQTPENGDILMPGICSLKIADISQLQVRADIPENYAGEIAEGQHANITCSALTQETIGACVKSIAPFARRAVSFTGEKTNATVSTILTLSRAADLKPGYSAQVRIFTGKEENAVMVPYEAVCQSETGKEYVFTVQDGIAKQQWVTTGRQTAGYLQIKTGLSSGEIVLCTPPDTLQSGDAVEVQGI